MHATLSIPELVEKIAFHVLDNPDAAGTLFSLALSCRALSDIALDALWREMDSLLPLFQLFPSLSFHSGGLDRDFYTFSSSINIKQVQRFAQYADRIHVYKQGECDEYELTSHLSFPPIMYAQIIFARQNLCELNSDPHKPINFPPNEELFPLVDNHFNAHFLPHLQYIHVVFLGSEIRYLLSPSLLSFVLEQPQYEPEDICFIRKDNMDYAFEILDLLPSCCPALEELQIHLFGIFRPEVSVSQFTLRSLKFLYLEQYDMVLDEDGPRSLSLQLTSLSVRSITFSSSYSLGLQEPTFPCIQNLHINSSTMSDVLTFLTRVTMPELKSLFLYLELGGLFDDTADKSIRQIFQALKERYGSTLTSLRLGQADDPPYSDLAEVQWSSPGLSMKSCHEILGLRLKCLSIHLPLYRTLDFDDLAAIIEAWPELHTLSIATRYPTRIGLDLLLMLAKGLLRLHHLHIGISSTFIPDGGLAVPLRHDHPLQFLNFQTNTVVTDPASFAKYLYLIFPRIKVVGYKYLDHRRHDISTINKELTRLRSEEDGRFEDERL